MTSTTIALNQLSYTDLGVGPFRFTLASDGKPISSGPGYAGFVEADAQPPAYDPNSFMPQQVEHSCRDIAGNVWSGTKRVWARGTGRILLTPLGSALTTVQASAGPVASLLRGAGTFRAGQVQNAGNAPVFLGPAGVTTGTGWPIAPGATLNTGDFAGELYVVAAAAQPVSGLFY